MKRFCTIWPPRLHRKQMIGIDGFGVASWWCSRCKRRIWV